MGDLVDANATNNNDHSLVVIADNTTASQRAGVTSGSRLMVDAALSSIASQNTTDVTGTFTATGNSGAIDSNGFSKISAILNVTAVSGTTPTLFVDLQESVDTTTWTSIASFTRLSATGTFEVDNVMIGKQYYRYVYTIAGTTPSFTFTIKTSLKTGNGTNIRMFRYSGLVTTATGNVSETFTAKGFPDVGIIIKRGSDAGGSLSIRIDASEDNVNWVELTGNVNIASGIALLGNNIVSQEFTGVSFIFYRVRVTDDTSVAATIDLFWSANGA